MTRNAIPTNETDPARATRDGFHRRGFLFGAGALLLAQPKLIASRLPLLWGDGMHDDTAALAKVLAGRPVRLGQTGDTFKPLFADGVAALIGGHYLYDPAYRRSEIGSLMPLRGPAVLLGAATFSAMGRGPDRRLPFNPSSDGALIVGCRFTYSEDRNRFSDPLPEVERILDLKGADTPEMRRLAAIWRDYGPHARAATSPAHAKGEDLRRSMN